MMVDANHAYDALAAIKLGRLLEPLDIAWFEEPGPPESLAGYRALQPAIGIPVSGRECESTRLGFREVFTRGVVDIIEPDISAAGGLTECRQVADMAAAFGGRYNPHGRGTGIGLAAALQRMVVLPPQTPPPLSPTNPVFASDCTEH